MEADEGKEEKADVKDEKADEDERKEGGGGRTGRSARTRKLEKGSGRGASRGVSRESPTEGKEGKHGTDAVVSSDEDGGWVPPVTDGTDDVRAALLSEKAVVVSGEPTDTTRKVSVYAIRAAVDDVVLCPVCRIWGEPPKCGTCGADTRPKRAQAAEEEAEKESEKESEKEIEESEKEGVGRGAESKDIGDRETGAVGATAEEEKRNTIRGGTSEAVKFKDSRGHLHMMRGAGEGKAQDQGQGKGQGRGKGKRHGKLGGGGDGDGDGESGELLLHRLLRHLMSEVLLEERRHLTHMMQGGSHGEEKGSETGTDKDIGTDSASDDALTWLLWEDGSSYYSKTPGDGYKYVWKSDGTEGFTSIVLALHIGDLFASLLHEGAVGIQVHTTRVGGVGSESLNKRRLREDTTVQIDKQRG